MGLNNNETERKELVDELAAAMRGSVRYAVALNGQRRDKIDEDIAYDIADGELPEVVEAIMPIIDRLLAAADEPGLGVDLDEMLAPFGNAPLYLHQFDEGGQWTANIDTAHGPIATGTTRMDAIRNVVAQATATQEGASDE